jgi:hypothetical protein
MPESELHDLTIEEREEYLRHYLLTNSLISDYTYSSLFMWAKFYSLELLYFKDLACVICTGGEFPPSLLMPLGLFDNKMKDVLDYYYEWFAKRGEELSISHVDEALLPVIMSVEGYNYTVTYDRSYSDYIYNRSDFVEMKGSDYKGFRKKIRAFENHHSDFEYSKISVNDIPECMELLELWRVQKGYDADALETVKLLDNYEALELKGGAVRINGKIQAFLLGEIYRETGYIIAGKADMGIHGLYLYAVREFVKQEFPGVKYINRCEDLGIETLRDAKLSWMPSQLLHKYNVRCKKI